LWHGASWNFVIWGGYHGTLLALERATDRSKFVRPPGALLYSLRALITFVLVCVGWVFFRAATLADSVHVIGEMFTGVWDSAGLLIPVWLLYFAGLTFLVALAEEKWEWIERLPHGPAWAYAAMVVAMLFSVELIGVTEKAVPFIYFQF
jgi:alginate O-acetyltransferase complex protein AlgI